MSVIQFGEAERSFAEFTVFLLRMRQPLHEAFLVNILDTAAALAGEEQRFFGGSFAATYPTGINIFVGSIGRSMC